MDRSMSSPNQDGSDLTGMAAIVTGGASGIGAALTTELCGRGASVLAVDLDAGGLERLSAATGCAILAADVATAESNVAIVEQCVAEFGRLDLAFLNAGVLDRPIETLGDPYVIGDIDWDRYDLVRGVLLDAVIHGTVAATPAMAVSGGGAIVATASVAGLMAWPMTPIYSATKHAVTGWVGAIAPALQRESVRINAICPGGIATPLVGRTAADADTIEHLLSPTQVAHAMIEIATGDGSGASWSIVANRDPVLQQHTFAPIPGFP